MRVVPWLVLLAFQEPATFQSEIALVQVDVEVASAGRLLDDLTVEDFRIEDEGRPREILYFGHEEEPLDIVLLIDTSASMTPVVQRISDTAAVALGELRAGDRVAVMAFDRDADLILDFTSDREQVGRAIREQVLTRGSPPVTFLQRAVESAARYLLMQPRGDDTRTRRRAILTVTDGQGLDAGRGGDAVRDLWEADTVLSAVVLPSGVNRVLRAVLFPPSLVGLGGIGGMVERSGGDVLKADDAGDGLRAMIRRLRARYVLHYAMPEAEPGKQRKIEVKLSREAERRYRDVKIRARRGYVVPAR